jgi:tRNA-binding protein
VTTAYDDFQRVEIRVGRGRRAEPLPEARRPALKLWIDFGIELGVLKVVLTEPERDVPVGGRMF